MPRAGESLGKYKLIRRIGLGGMAEVWLARVTGPGGFSKTLVVKTVLEHQAQNAEFVAQFLDEARLAALLTHPNIVQIFELGEAAGTYFIAMEYVQGRDLQDVRKQCVERARPFPYALLARIACGVCTGLHYAHELSDDEGRLLNLVHRDVSPENVIISYDGIVKLVDFGIAKASISQVTTRAGLFKGKLHYATPERLLGQPIDRRDDIYGLGAVLYETAAGTPPISGRSEGEMVKKILDGDYPRPRELVPQIPAELERIILKCMAWEPADRYPSARDMQADLERFVAESGEPATSFDLAEFMRELFEGEVGAGSGRVGAADLAELAASEAAEGAEHAAAPRPEPWTPELDGPTLEEPGLEEPTTEVVAPRPAWPREDAWPARAPAPEPAPYAPADEEPPSAPRRPVGLLAGGLAVLLAAAGAIVLAAWAPWSSAGVATSGADAASPGDRDLATVVQGPADSTPGDLLLLPTVDAAAPDSAPGAVDGGPADDEAGEAEEGDGGLEDEAAPALTAIDGPSGVLSLRGPAGCTARLGRDRLGGLPLERPLPVGTHEVSVLCPFGARRAVTVTIREGETASETVRLRTGSLLLLVRPWAEVSVDGRSRGITPLGEIELPEGNHSVRLVNNEIGARRTMSVRIRPGERTTLRVRLDQASD